MLPLALLALVLDEGALAVLRVASLLVIVVVILALPPGVRSTFVLTPLLRAPL